MAVKDCVVSDLCFVVKVEELFNVVIVILHVVSLTNVGYYTTIKPFNQKFNRSDPE